MEEADEEDQLTDAKVLVQLMYVSPIPSLIHDTTTPHRTLVFTLHNTTSSTLTHLHLLAVHHKIQDRLQKEIRDAKDAWEHDHIKGDRDVGYGKVNELPFLESVCHETLHL